MSTNGIASRPIGTFSQKIHSQSMPSTTSPPMNGPLATARPVTALKMPIAVPRRSGGKAALRRARASGSTIAPPTPCTVRAAMSQPASGARAQAADAAANRPRPMAYIRRRPKRSPSAAPVISSTAKLRL